MKKILPLILVLLLSACQNTEIINSDNRAKPKKPPKSSEPVTIEGRCAQRTIDGYRDDIKISVKDNVVNSLDWKIVPKSGACRFELKNFTQVATSPTAKLEHKKDKKCNIYVWQDDRHITVATYNCKKLCKQNDRLLPVLLEHDTGACKPAGNDNPQNTAKKG
ncbi:hypothetical protein GCM10009007_11630 [Formosimonas limnophila]|uniref:Lipoprotein n=1 Tax=Formosimonas limnophila TaxID=1384487 RepID=A0A8J3CMU1_9BURK|nr:hypothetical protein [Formosimonas limnophila]GHA72325.1 hypothetical protein GCM10009007_11630 [Formosimonas limnophila]